MTSSLDSLQQGSFRGVQFNVGDHTAGGGRRVASHEYPYRDEGWAEDLGRSSRTWTIRCFVIGQDWASQRDALVTALEQSGAGTLIHPWLGSKQVVVDGDYQLTETTGEGGKATFSIPFREAGADQTPAATTDTQGQAQAAATNLQSTAATSAATGFSLTGQPDFVQEALAGQLGSAGGAISAALAAVAPGSANIFALGQQLAAFTTAPLSLLGAPAALAMTIFSAVAAIGDQAAYADDALQQLTGPTGAAVGNTHGLIGWGTDQAVPPALTPSTVAQAGNQVLLAQLVQCAAASAAVSVVASMDFTSYDDAIGIRDPLADQLDDLAVSIADSGNSALANAVDTLRVAMIIDVTARGGSLARLYQWTPPAPMPALVIAQRLYQDATRADEICDRNDIANPLFVPGGVALEVLTVD